MGHLCILRYCSKLLIDVWYHVQHVYSRSICPLVKLLRNGALRQAAPCFSYRKNELNVMGTQASL